MSKKIGVTLIVVALAITIAYSVVAGVTFVKECPVKTTTPVTVETEGNVAEVIYNALLYGNGSYEYDIQVYVNVDKAIKGLTAVEATDRRKALTSAVADVKRMLEKSGARIKKTEEYFVNAELANYDSATDRAIAYGESGYDRYESDVKTYNGVWYSWYVSESTTVFADAESENYLNYAIGKLKTMGGLKSEEIDLVFNYGTKYSVNAITSDADVIYRYVNNAERTECYMHEFRMTEATRTKKITLVQQSPNVWSWYLVAIVPVLFVSGVILLIAGRKRR